MFVLSTMKMQSISNLRTNKNILAIANALEFQLNKCLLSLILILQPNREYFLEYIRHYFWRSSIVPTWEPICTEGQIMLPTVMEPYTQS